MDALDLTLVLLMLAWFYLLPTWIALARHHHQRASIVLTNLLGGWLVIPWCIALVWSVSATPPAH